MLVNKTQLRVNSPEKYEVLIVDDDRSLLQTFELILDSSGIKTHSFDNGLEAIRAVKQHPFKFAAAIIDLNMPEIRGDEIAKQIREINPDLTIRMMSGDNSEAAINDFIDARIDGYYFKPVKISEKVLPDLKAIFEKFEETQKVSERVDPIAHFREQFGLVGRSKTTVDIAEQIMICAPTNSTVLLLGENGTGKEVCAKAIHKHSPRKDKPFIAINCGALSEELIESELFGHMKGSFTGASQYRMGKFEAAQGGTLFLDEIGDMPLGLQVKLLRVLEEKEITPLGSNKPIKVDVRIIAATNVDLPKAVHANRFRQDLFYRLNVFPIQILPLRERREDIEPLLWHFREKNEFGSKVQFLASVVRKLTNYSWPGNIRELKHTVDFLCLKARDRKVELKDLDPKFFSKHDDSASLLEDSNSLITFEDLERIYEEAQKRLLKLAYQQANGQQKIAAELVKCPASTIRSLVKRWGLRNEDFVNSQKNSES